MNARIRDFSGSLPDEVTELFLHEVVACPNVRLKRGGRIPGSPPGRATISCPLNSSGPQDACRRAGCDASGDTDRVKAGAPAAARSR